jgi:DUF3052 family protein
VPERNYDHRRVVDKLGVKLGHAVAYVPDADAVDDWLRTDIATQTAREPAGADEPVDTVIAIIDDGTDVVELLREWRPRLQPAGGIWLLSPKRGRQGYVNQETLIPLGLEAGLVDNKVCSVSDRQSAMRFVIRRRDRGT